MLTSHRGIVSGGAGLAVAATCAGVCVLASSGRKRNARRAALLLTPGMVTKMINEVSSRAIDQGSCADIQVSAVAIPQIAHCGDGKASTTDRIVVSIEYDHAGRASLVEVPKQLIFKCILLPGFMRVGASPGILALVSSLGKLFGMIGLEFLVYRGANIVNYYLPHAPDSMYENETRFYRDIRSELSIETPSCYGTLYDPRNRQFGILMEDLCLKGATFPTAVDDIPIERVEHLVRSLASLHATYWQSARLEGDGDLAWLPTPRCGGMAEVFQKLGRGLIDDHVRADPLRRELIKPIGLSVGELWEGLRKAEEALMVPPLTLCHGDAHVQNTYWLEDGTVGLFDWQLALKCSWARDVAYCIGTGLSRKVRREKERGLLELYLKELALNGVRQPPSMDDAFLLYRKTMAWGLVIGWLICPPNNYGPEITSANIDKLVSACIDLESFAALGIV